MRARFFAAMIVIGASACNTILGVGDVDYREDGVCTPGATRCSGNTPETCDTDGLWQASAECVKQTCEAGQCIGVCAPGDRRCADDRPETCDSSGQWTTGEPCAAGTQCSGGVCGAICVPGDIRCAGNAPEACDAAGHWKSAGACVHATCVAGECAGECAPTEARCAGSTPESCDADGAWEARTPCASSCVSGSCPGPSCDGLPSKCSASALENCCLSPVVTGGTFNRGNDVKYPATVSDFRLDRFEVTVGRFRAFVASYPDNRPVTGAGAHPLIANSGWRPAWDVELPETRDALVASLKCHADQTWTDGPKSEGRPLNCVSWYTAFAFCAWDGGRLPTEAEWNYAAAGGDEQRIYPWSSPPQSQTIDGSHAVFDSIPIEPVGARSPKGDGRWGHADLAGNVWEWMLDTSSDYPTPCVDCANLAPNPRRVTRGGGAEYNQSLLLTSNRGDLTPSARVSIVGFRCARSP